MSAERIYKMHELREMLNRKNNVIMELQNKNRALGSVIFVMAVIIIVLSYLYYPYTGL
jgi:hypothetical protein